MLIKLLLFASLLMLFYGLTVGTFPDVYRVKEVAVKYLIPAASALCFFVIGAAFFMTPAAGLIWAVLGWFVPLQIAESTKCRRQKKLKELAKNFITSSAGLFGAGQTTAEVLRAISENIEEPMQSEFKNMIAIRNMNPQASFPKLFEDMAAKYDISEFKAAAAILAASEQAGGAYAAAKGFKRLGRALRQRDKLLTEREKATMEPKIAAYVVLGILIFGLFMDATIFRDLFASGAGKVDMFVSSALVVGLIFMVAKITGRQEIA